MLNFFDKLTKFISKKNNSNDTEILKLKISTSSLARKHNIDRDKLFNYFIDIGYLIRDEKNIINLTQKGLSNNGEYFYTEDNSKYVVWPENLLDDNNEIKKLKSQNISTNDDLQKTGDSQSNFYNIPLKRLINELVDKKLSIKEISTYIQKDNKEIFKIISSLPRIKKKYIDYHGSFEFYDNINEPKSINNQHRNIDDKVNSFNNFTSLKLTNVSDLPIEINKEYELFIQIISKTQLIINLNEVDYKIRITKINPPESNGLYKIKKVNYGKNNEYSKLEYKKLENSNIVEKPMNKKEINDSILFIDIEPYNNSNDFKIREIGVLVENFEFKSQSAKKIYENIKNYDIEYICGHNLRKFDIEYLANSSLNFITKDLKVIDTLELSYLFFPFTEVHKLPKNYFENDDFLSDPLKDSKLTKELFYNLLNKFNSFDYEVKNLYYSLLKNYHEYSHFFDFSKDELKEIDIFEVIINRYSLNIENKEYLKETIEKNKLELSFIVSIFEKDIKLYTFSPIINERYPHIQEIFNKLVFNAKKEIDNLEKYLKDSFNFETFRPPFSKIGDTLETISQRDIVAAALNDENIFTILPTGGGKTLTFWLPAIIKAKKTRGLTVVISPLQALMKDHIHNFNEKLLGQSSAAALSGYLTMPERRDIISKIINGSLDILYVAPESLRSKNLENILTYRYIDRFVIDEAHCLSTWGNDFRHDYFYIAEFINKIVSKKISKYKQNIIPISVFTATANIKTIKEIKNYFKEELNIEFKDFIASSKRKNLRYKSFKVNSEKQKNEKIIEILREVKNESSLIYIPSSRKKCEDIAEKLSEDLNRRFVAFHAGISSKDRANILEEYLKKNSSISGIVATTAFGMGIDKPDIRHVIHYEISSSLEDYLQESGRAGRDGTESFCYVVYQETDFAKLFHSLIRQKVTFNEIKKVFQSIKQYKGRKQPKQNNVLIQASIKDLAEKIGIDTDDESSDFDSKIKTAILELERCNYLKRSYNKPKIYASSNINNMQEVRNLLQDENLKLEDNPNELIERICSILIKKSTKSFSLQLEKLAELVNEDVNKIYKTLYIMRDINLISLEEDLLISNFDKSKFKRFIDLLIKTLNVLKRNIFIYNNKDIQIRELNQMLKDNGIDLINYEILLPKILMLFRSKGEFEFYRYNIYLKKWNMKIINQKYLKDKIDDYINLVDEVFKYLNSPQNVTIESDKSIVIKYHNMIERCNLNLGSKFKISEYDKLFLLFAKSKLFILEGGRVIYDTKIEIILDNEHVKNKGFKYYTDSDYSVRMKPMYNFKRESFHIINRFVEELDFHEDKAMKFATDYFDLDYSEFIKKYNLQKRIKLPLPENKYKQIINQDTTLEQKEIIKDSKSNSMLILAGPGTGKTQILINKIAHMIIEEDFKPENFLMLTYTKSAALVFKNRLFKLIGDLAYNIDIFTFHGYAVELLGEYKKDKNETSIQNSLNLIRNKIKNNEISLGFKQVIILDEFQDTGEEAYFFVNDLYKSFSNQDENRLQIKIIAVGDDDQCIMSSLNGANIEYMNKFKDDYSYEFKQYTLTTNFRSHGKIINMTNNWINKLKYRIDDNKKMLPQKENDLFSSGGAEVKIIHYNNSNFIDKIYEDYIKETSSKEVAILTHENDMVLDIYSFLKLDSSLDVNFLLKNDEFRLFQLDEIVYFTEQLSKGLELSNNSTKIIPHDLFNLIKDKTYEEYKNSKILYLIKKHINDFENEHDILTLSFWDSFVNDTIIGDFIIRNNRILISTIHRSKGSEFEEVHIFLNKLHNQNDMEYFIRLYYVAMTRAKNKLFIHTSTNIFETFSNQIEYIYNDQSSDDISFPYKLKITQFKDVYLGFGLGSGYGYNTRLKSGEIVTIEERINFNKFNNTTELIYDIKHNSIAIGQLSKKFSKEVKELLNSGYMIDKAEILYRTHYYLKDKMKSNIVYLYNIHFKTTL